MINSILYISMFGFFLVTALLYPKTRNINFVSGFMLSYITALCYGAIGALFIKILRAPINLLSMSVIYAIGGAFLLIGIIKRRSLQKFTFRLFDFGAIFIMLMVFGRIAVYIFSRHVNINYANMPDSGNHFYMAMSVVRANDISGMYFTPLFNAMFIELLLPLVPETWSYKLFILSDCYHNLMELFFFYGFMLYISKGNKNKWLPVAVTFLHWCGYQLYGFIDAYIYWGMGATLVLYGIFILKIYENNLKLRLMCMILLVLGCYGIIVCYIEFAPAIVLAIIIAIVYTRYKENNFCLDKGIKATLIVLSIILCICAGIGYYLVFKSPELDIFEALNIGVNDSRNLEILISIPIIYYIAKRQLKEKRVNVYTMTLFSFLLVQIGFTVLAALNKMSSYYLFKSYFIFWSLIWIILLSEIKIFEGKVRTYTLNYLAIILIFVMFSYVPKTSDIAPYSIDNSIWRVNADKLQIDFRDSSLNATKMDMIDEIYYKWGKEGKSVVLIGTNYIKGECAWYSGITDQPIFWRSPLNQEHIAEYLETINPDYIFIFYDSDAYEENAEYLETFEKVYETEEGFVAKVE